MEKGAEDPLPKSKWRKEPEEILTSKFNSKKTRDISYKEARERRSVVLNFHYLVQRHAHKQEILEKEEDRQTIKVFDYA